MTFIQMMKIMGKKLYQTVDQTPSYFHHTKATYPYADPLNLENKILHVCQSKLLSSTFIYSEKIAP